MAEKKETNVEETAEVSDLATAAPAVVAPVEPAAPVVNPDTTDFVAIRDFGAWFDHQILNFKEGEVIDHRVGSALRALGSPIKLVEK